MPRAQPNASLHGRRGYHIDLRLPDTKDRGPRTKDQRRYTRYIVRVLMVEDDATIADFVSKGLTEAGYVVDVAADGERGVELAIKGGYDAAIVDVMLPRLDGLALIDRIRARGVRTPVLILSARRTVDDRVKGSAGGWRRLPDKAVRVRGTACPSSGAHQALDWPGRADQALTRRPVARPPQPTGGTSGHTDRPSPA